MVVCEPVSRESLLENYLLLPTDIVGNLRPLIVGGDYSVRKYATGTGAGLVGAYDSAAGVSSAWPSLAANETVDLTTAEVWVVNALANYYADTAPVPAITEGTQSGTTPNAITHNSAATIWAGASFTPALNNAVVVGDYVKLDDMGGNTLETRVLGFDYVVGSPTILLLEDSLPAALTGGAFFNVILAEVVPTYELPAADVTLAAATVQADAAITLATDRTGTPVALIEGLTFGAVALSVVYTNYRALRIASAATIQILSITTEAELNTYFVGWQYPESGLGFAVRRAFSPVPADASTRPAVLCTAIVSDDSTGWQAAADRILRRRDWYACSVLTVNLTFQQIFTTVISSRRAIDLHSELFLVLELTEETTILTGAGNTVEVDQSLTPGLDRTVTRDGGVASPFSGAIVDDIVQIAGVDYIIDTKVSNQVVTIKSNAGAGAGQTLNNVRHPLTTAEQADDYGTRAQAFADREVSVIFPPDPTWEAAEVDGYLLAAASAGARGYTIPHQSLTGVILEDGWGVPQSTFEFLGYLSLLADYGVFVYEQCDAVTTPNAVVLQSNTTDQSATIDSREGLVANEDAIRRYLADILVCNRGRTKAVGELLGELRVQATNAITYLKSNTLVDTFGRILVTGVVTNPYFSTTSQDIAIVPVTVTIAATLEEVSMLISVSLAANT